MTDQELAAVKQCMGSAGDDCDADNALDKLLAHVKGLKKPEEVTALSSAVTEKESKITELSAVVTAKDTEIAALKSKIPAPADPAQLTGWADLTVGRIELAANKGEIPGVVAKRLTDLVKGKDGKPSLFLLSASDELGGKPVDVVLKLFDGMKFDGDGVKTGVQVLSRAVPDGKEEDKNKDVNPLLDTAKQMFPAKA